MSESTEGFIDIRLVLERIEEDADLYVTRTERMGYMLPEGTTKQELNNLIVGFWEYPSEVVSDITDIFKEVPVPKAPNA